MGTTGRGRAWQTMGTGSAMTSATRSRSTTPICALHVPGQTASGDVRKPCACRLLPRRRQTDRMSSFAATSVTSMNETAACVSVTHHIHAVRISERLSGGTEPSVPIFCLLMKFQSLYRIHMFFFPFLSVEKTTYTLHSLQLTEYCRQCTIDIAMARSASASCIG
jgi:hypothetical protein